MSEQPLELVRRFFEATDRAFAGYWDNPRSIAEALEADDLDPAGEEAFSLLDPNVVWRAGDFGVYRGHMEMARAWDDLLEIAADYRVSIHELVDCGDGRVLVAADRKLIAKGSGLDMTHPAFLVVTVRDDLISQCDEYLDRAQALAAAGLAPSSGVRRR